MESILDLELHVQQLRFIRSLAETEPFKSSTIREVDPGLLHDDDESLRSKMSKRLSEGC